MKILFRNILKFAPAFLFVVTVHVVTTAQTAKLQLDQLDVLAGRARFPARGDAVGRTGLDGRPVPVEQDDSPGPVLLLLAGQLIEPFQARR